MDSSSRPSSAKLFDVEDGTVISLRPIHACKGVFLLCRIFQEIYFNLSFTHNFCRQLQDTERNSRKLILTDCTSGRKQSTRAKIRQLMKITLKWSPSKQNRQATVSMAALHLYDAAADSCHMTGKQGQVVLLRMRKGSQERLTSMR